MVAQGVLDRRVPGHSPEPRRRTGGNRCGELRDAEAAKLRESLVPVLPLSPEIHSQSPANPSFQVCEHARGLAERKVPAPSNEVRREVFDDPFQIEASCPACDVPNSVFELSERFRRNASFAPVVRNTEPQELALFRSCHPALGLLTFSRSLSVRNRVIEAMTRSPAR